jgi:prepilin-type N-terminal cleavage/methylation domain-containing protein
MVKHKYFKDQKGFTLVEIAIVLVIIGLLIGGILKGQSMIENAKVKRLAKDIEGIRVAVISFQDRYNMLPGDENSTTVPSAADTINGNRNGWITAAEWPTDDLILAGLLSGTVGTLPSNPYSGGTFNVFSATIGVGTYNYIVATNIPPATCQELDTKNDDGIWNTGTIRGNADYMNPGTAVVFTLYERI